MHMSLQLAVVLGFATLGLVSAYISFNISDEFKAMQTLMLIGALSMLALGGASIYHIAVSSGIVPLVFLGSSSTIIFSALLLMGLFFLFLELTIFTFEKLLSTKNKAPRRRGGK